jgi:hypothetical protein
LIVAAPVCTPAENVELMLAPENMFQMALTPKFESLFVPLP